MKINVSDLAPDRVKTKLLVIPKKDKKKKIDIIKNRFLAQRVIEVFLEDYGLENIRKLGAKAANLAKEFKVDELSIVFPNVNDYYEASKCLVEGVILSSYDFDKFKTKKENHKLKHVTILSKKNLNEIKKGIRFGETVSKYVCLARDFVNDPANHATPDAFADRIAEISKKNKLKIKIYNEKQIKKMGMGCFLGVAQGTRKEPKLVVIEYKGTKKKDFYALVGKGITFDSGGISLKPSQGMHEMKGDMAGGAAVACAINAIAELRLPVNIIAVIPCVENMPGGNAMKPGDVLKSMSGKTVEVINTDAEGRLALADALYFVARKKPKAIIDIATLTGACVVALGYHVAGLVGNDDKLTDLIFKAGEKTNEKVWKLPLYKEYSEAIKSDIADIKNIGYDNGAAGPLTAAAFLKEFVDEIPWAHIDMAGTFWSKENKDYYKKGATGWGVRLFVELFNSLSVKSA